MGGYPPSLIAAVVPPTRAGPPEPLGPLNLNGPAPAEADISASSTGTSAAAGGAPNLCMRGGYPDACGASRRGPCHEGQWWLPSMHCLNPNMNTLPAVWWQMRLLPCITWHMSSGCLDLNLCDFHPSMHAAAAFQSLSCSSASPNTASRLLLPLGRLTCWLADERAARCMQSQGHRAHLAAVHPPALQQQLQRPAARQPQRGGRRLLRRCSRTWRPWRQSCSRQGRRRCGPCRPWLWGGWCRREAVPGHALGRLR